MAEDIKVINVMDKFGRRSGIDRRRMYDSELDKKGGIKNERRSGTDRRSGFDRRSGIERRREVAGLYHEGLKDVEEISLVPGPEEDGKYYDVFQNYVIRSPRRDELAAYLREKGIETLISWPKPMHHHKALNLSHFNLPETEKLSREVVSLPMNTEVTDEQVGYVIEVVKDFHSKEGVLLGSDNGSSEQQ